MDFVLENITPPIAVAVSGGADSLALTLLAQTWAQAIQGHIVALTVDHELRPDSAQEASQVKAWLEYRGIKHVTLKWEGDKPLSRLQERAREARYNLLISWCKANHISTLLLGHHQQDQEETFWLRLTAGSGLDGLTAMKERCVREGITLIRPLLNYTKGDLQAFLKTQNQEWIEDPSNKHSGFFRSRFRAALEQEGLSSPRLGKIIKKLQEDLDFIQENLIHAIQTVLQHHEEGFLSLHKEAFNALHPSLSKRLIALCIQWFSSTCYPPRSEILRGILEKLKTPSPFTAGGIYWFSQAGKIYLSRELSVMENSLFLKKVGQSSPWDHRFYIHGGIKDYFPEEAFIAPLGIAPLPRRNDLDIKIPPRLLSTLPAIWVQETIAAIPHLCYTSANYRKDIKKFISTKPLFHDSLRFTI